MKKALSKAVQAVAEGNSVRGAAKSNGIQYSSLYKRVRSSCQKRDIMLPYGKLLYKDEEELLEKYVIECAEVGFPQSLENICEAAHWIVANFPRPTKSNCLPGRHFALNFIKRRANLSLRTPSTISKAATSVTKASLANWFLWFEDYLRSRGLFDVYINSPERVFNCDETPLPASAKPTKAVAAKGTRHVYKLASPNNKQMFTMLATLTQQDGY